MHPYPAIVLVYGATWCFSRRHPQAHGAWCRESTVVGVGVTCSLVAHINFVELAALAICMSASPEWLMLWPRGPGERKKRFLPQGCTKPCCAVPTSADQAHDARMDQPTRAEKDCGTQGASCASELRSGGSGVVVTTARRCDRCDGDHITTDCPHYKKPRGNDPDEQRSRAHAHATDDTSTKLRLKHGQVHRQPPDGTCLYHSLKAAANLPMTALELRKQLAADLLSKKHEQHSGYTWSEWVKHETGSSIEKYTTDIAKSGWGGGMELALFRMRYQCSITVYERAPAHATYEYTRIAQYGRIQSDRHIRLLYSGNSHYDYITPHWDKQNSYTKRQRMSQITDALKLYLTPAEFAIWKQADSTHHALSTASTVQPFAFRKMRRANFVESNSSNPPSEPPNHGSSERRQQAEESIGALAPDAKPSPAGQRRMRKWKFAEETAASDPQKRTTAKDLTSKDAEVDARAPSATDSSEDSSDNDDSLKEYLTVRLKDNIGAPTEQDMILRKCQRLADEYIRSRPTLPASWEDPSRSWEDTNSGWSLPLYSCPFKHCTFHTEKRVDFLIHLGGVNSPHRADIERICWPPDTPYMTRMDYVNGAVSVHERRQWPRLGLSITRRSLRNVAQAYNDETTQCLTCFVCCEQRTTLSGPVHPDFEEQGLAPKQRRNIEYRGDSYFEELERVCPHTLLNNCSYLLWRERYVHKDTRNRHVKVAPLATAQPQTGPRTSKSWNHISDWTIVVRVHNRDRVLFGCTEDVVCTADGADHNHAVDFQREPYCRRLCSACKVPSTQLTKINCMGHRWPKTGLQFFAGPGTMGDRSPVPGNPRLL